ncbi:hypothetical protein ScPMuIL_002503 [Solemya velum]
MGGKNSSGQKDKAKDNVQGKQWEHKRRRDYDEVDSIPESGGVRIQDKYPIRPRNYDEVEILPPNAQASNKREPTLNYIQVEVGASGGKVKKTHEKTAYTEVRITDKGVAAEN